MNSLHLAIGIFDGIHKGHHYLIHSAIENAQKTKTCSGVLTFHPHPKQVLHSPNAPQLIYPIQHRYWLLKKLGCNFVFITNFTESWSHSTPEHFFTYLQHLFPNLTNLYVGEDFRFGYKRAGDTKTLQKFCQTNDIQLHVVQQLKQDGEKICSTRVRQALQTGLILTANQLLAKPYHCIGYCTPTKQFKHHCELKIKDGTYSCHIIHKTFKQHVILQIHQGIYQIISSLEPIFIKTTCLLQFEKEL